MMDLEEESDGLGGQKRDGHAKGEEKRSTWRLYLDVVRFVDM